MKPFGYLIPKSLARACSLLSEYQGRAKIIAGGQSMLPQLKQRLISPEFLIEIKHLEGLQYVKRGRDGVKIGAMTTHRAIESSPVIKQKFPMLVEMEMRLADSQVRNWGTIGGNLSHADPTGDPAPPLIALGAKVKATSVRGSREIALESFFLDFMTTALADDEILTEISIPYLPPHTAGAYYKETVRPNDSAIASAAVVIGLDGKTGRVTRANIVLGGVGSTPIPAEQAAQLLIGKKVNAGLVDQVGAMAVTEIRPTSDMHTSEEYKRMIAKVVVAQMVNSAAKRALDG